MNLPSPPSADTVTRDLEDLLGLFQRVMRNANSNAREFFSNLRREPDASLFPPMIRYFAKIEFSELGQAVYDEVEEDDQAETHELTLEPLGNNGLCLDVKGYRIRILKADRDGRVPDPGNSKRKREFYSQIGRQLPLPLQLEQPEPERPQESNLLLLWELNVGTYDISRMWLVYPSGYSETTKHVSNLWRVELKPEFPTPDPSIVPPDYRKNVSAAPNGAISQNLPIKLKQ